MKRLLIALFMIVVAAGAAHAQCTGGLITNCPTAVNPQTTDVLPLWQYGQKPNQRKISIGQLPTGSNQPVTATGTNTPRTLGNRFADVVNVMDWACSNGISCQVGIGNDDIAAIQAAINQAAAAGAQEVFFPQPPSGAYNICAADIELPGQTISLRLQGATVGGTTIRILPSCASPPQQVIHQPRTTNQNDTTRITLSHLTIDGYCKATYDLYSEFAVGFDSDHVAYRNAATGGANIRIGSGGFEYDIGNTNTAENVNDPGHTCYNTSADLPNYNLWMSGTDSRFDGLIAVDAKIANVYQDSGGNNRFIGTHTWNYYTIPESGTVDLRSQYGFYLVGMATVIGGYSEDYTGSGIYISNASGVGLQRIIGNHFGFTGNPANTVLGVEIASGTTYANVEANEAWQLKYIGYPQNIVKQDGTADVTVIVQNNMAATYQSVTNILSPGANTQETWLNLKNPSTNSFALTGMNWTANNSTGAITYQDAGTSTGGYFIVQPENASSAAPTLHVFDGADGWDVMGGNIGSEALRAVLHTTNVNRIEAYGATTGNDPILQTAGSDTNVPFIIGSKGPLAPIYLEPDGLLQTTVSHTGMALQGQFQSPGAFNALSRSAATAAHDNMRVNPAMSAPAWQASSTYSPGNVVKNGSNYYEEQSGQQTGPVCTSAASGGPSGTGLLIVDGSCLWNFAPSAVATNAVTPTVTPGSQWTTSAGYGPNSIVATFSGSGATSQVNLYTQTTGGNCTSASSGSGPSGTGTGISDGSCTWNYATSGPAAPANTAGPHSYIWNSGAGTAVTNVRFYNGLPTTDTGSGYEKTIATTVASVRGQQNYARYEFVTNSKKFVIRSYENYTGINWRLIVCNIQQTECQYFSPTPYAMYAGGYAYTVIDFSAVGGQQPRDIIMENDEGGFFGGVDVLATEDVYLPSGGYQTLTMAVSGDSYPAGSGVPVGYSDFVALMTDNMGVRNLINTAIGGCGYIVSCSSGTAISRIADVENTNPFNGSGGCPDILLVANGTNDVGSSTPSAIAAAQTAYVNSFRGTCGVNIPIVLMGIWAHNFNGANFSAGVAAENAMATAAAAMNDPNLIFVRVIGDPQGSWQTGTGFVGQAVGTASFATNVMTVSAMTSGSWQIGMTVSAASVAGGTTITSLGTGTGGTGTYNLSTTPGTIGSESANGTGAKGDGNSDWALEGTNLHPNAVGNRIFVNRLTAAVRAAINAGGY